MIDPDPCRPENSGEQRFCVTWRNIDDQIPNPPLADSLQVVADGVHVHAIDEPCFRFQHAPRLPHECMQLAACLLRLQLQAAEPRPVPWLHRVVGFVLARFWHSYLSGLWIGISSPSRPVSFNLSLLG